MRLATWNVNSLRVREQHLLQWLDESQTDVVCLQETKLTDDQFPADALRAAGWEHLAWTGQQTYNGVAMVSRYPLEDVRLELDPAIDRDQKRYIAATVNGIRVIGLYVVNGKQVGSEHFDWKLQWLDRLLQHLREDHDPSQPLMLCGDFNIAPDDLDVWDPFKTEGRLLCHPDERERFQQMIDWGLVDPFREHNPFANEFSWWDYRQMGWQRNHGLRIDHTLLTQPLMDRCTDTTIWRDVRGWDQPSDHVPVSVDLED